MRTKLENIIFGKIGFKNGIKKKTSIKRPKQKLRNQKDRD